MDTAAAAVVVSALVAVAGAGAGRHCEQVRDTRDYSGYQLLSLGQHNLSATTLNYLSESELFTNLIFSQPQHLHSYIMRVV